MNPVPTWAQHLATPRTGVSPTMWCTLHTRTIANARALSADDLRATVAYTYTTLLTSLPPGHHPLRIWNTVPGITDDLPPGTDTDRYMAFNAGRHDAFSLYFPDLPNQLPAASAVGPIPEEPGPAASDLTISLLSTTSPGTPIHNPRQTPSHQYSQRYGKLPPCFSRAILWKNHLMISGTAAITGEDTQHEQDLSAQLHLTLDNLRALLSAARETGAASSTAADLTAIRHLRAYVPQSGHIEPVRDGLRHAMPDAELELIQAQLCRRNLLVEVEGLAVLGS